MSLLNLLFHNQGKGRPIGGTKPVVITYTQKVQALSPIAYWPLNETSGTTAVAVVGTNGTYKRNVTTMTTATGIGDGNTAPVFTAGSDNINIYSAGLVAAFKAATGSIVTWSKVSGVAIWTDGVERKIIQLYADGSNRIDISKAAANNVVALTLIGGGTNKSVAAQPISDVGWMCWALTWDTSGGGQLIAYKNGSQSGTTQTGIGTLVGSFSNSFTWIGSTNAAAALGWDGNLAHIQIYDKVLTPAQILSLATI